MIRPFVYADTNKFYTSQSFETNLSSDVTVQGGAVLFGLKSFILERRNSLMSELSSSGCIVNAATSTGERAGFEIFPNPAGASFSFKCSNEGQNQISIFNSIGLKVYEIKKVSSGESIDVSGLTSGVYYIEVNDFRKEKIVICR